MLKNLRLSFTLIFSGICFISALVIGTSLLIGKIFYPHGYSMHATWVIVFSSLTFFLIFLGIVVPAARRTFKYFKISKANPFDGLATILIALVSAIPLLILLVITFFVLRFSKKRPYYFFHIVNSVVTVLLGVWIKYHGEKDDSALLKVLNHTSLFDYFLCALSVRAARWNVVAGINLKRNKKTLEDKLVSFFLGKIIEDYAITIDREDGASRSSVLRSIIKSVNDGNNVIIFPERGRTPKEDIKNGILLRSFADGAFVVSWNTGISIQPIVLDFPVIWRGKGDDWWGIRPCVVDIHYLPSVSPKNFNSMQEFKDYCWNEMYQKICASKKVQKFIQKK
ncbi:MAG: lysophospholipid acyltransferase family protein [bacterium]